MTPLTHQPLASQVLNHLGARLRLGEQAFLLPTRLRPVIKCLVAEGLVTADSGNVENTLRVSLTPKGIEEVLSPTYEPPVAALHARATGGWCNECDQRFPCRTRRMLMPTEV